MASFPPVSVSSSHHATAFYFGKRALAVALIQVPLWVGCAHTSTPAPSTQKGASENAARLSSVPACKETSRLGEMCRLAVTTARPTQFAVGFRAVSDKEKKIAKRQGDEAKLDAYLEEDTSPVVIGPEGVVYIIDGHHLGRALWNLGIKETYASVTANLADLGETDFWRLMDEKKWVYPFDEKGEGPQPFSLLPKTFGDMRDDPFRSLASAVREEKGFQKSSEPFAEFRWAEHFRARIPLEVVSKDFDGAVKRALALTGAEDASSLPGFQPK